MDPAESLDALLANYATDDAKLFAIVEDVMSARLIAELNLSPETET